MRNLVVFETSLVSGTLLKFVAGRVHLISALQDNDTYSRSSILICFKCELWKRKSF